MISQQSLVESAVAEIKERIATGVLAADERILEAPLAEALGISRPPLREALRILTTQHFLDLIPRRGYRVRGLSERDIAELYGLRTVLERYALDLITRSEKPLQLLALDETLAEMWRAADRGDARAVMSANRDFHMAFIRLAGNTRLEQTYSTVLEQMGLYMIRNISQEADQSGGLQEGCRRHEDFLESLRSGDPARIDEALRRHGEQRFLLSSSGASPGHG